MLPAVHQWPQLHIFHAGIFTRALCGSRSPAEESEMHFAGDADFYGRQDCP